MKLSLNWISEFVGIPKNTTPTQVADLVTLHTAEVEECVDEARAYANMVVGKVISLKPHPNADRLQITETDIGEKTVQHVCGGQNLKVGMLVAVALPGAIVQWHGSETVELKETKVRGEASMGMICAGEEIGLEADNIEGSSEVKIHDLAYTKSLPGTPLAEALKKNDVVLDIDNKSLTHRPDLWGHYGFAREISTIFKKPLKPLDSFLAYKLEGKKEAELKVTIEDNDICPRFSGCIVKNVEICESPQWIKNHLMAVGIKPINNIVDITNFVMIELGQPMHAYDRKIIEDDTLSVRYAKNGEALETIDHKKRELTGRDPIVCNKKGVLGLAGIMGGAHSEITENTTEVVFESANWNPIVVRKSSTHHGLRSEASQRYEKSMDPSLTDLAIKRALFLLQESNPNAIVISPLSTVGGWKPSIKTIELDTDFTNSKIGVEVSSKEIVGILTRLGFEVHAKGKKLTVSVPSHRATGDVSIAEDLIEEVARIYGYENIPAQLPSLPINLPRENRTRSLENNARKILSRYIGLNEVQTYSFYGDRELTASQLSKESHLEMLNPLSEDQKYMRTTLLPTLLNVVHHNLKYRPDFSIFEIGRTYLNSSEYFPKEETFITALFVSKSDKDLFYNSLGALQEFLARFKTSKSRVMDTPDVPTFAHPKKCASLYIQKDEIAKIFELHPQILKNFDISGGVATFELNLTKLIALDTTTQKFQPLPRFPGIEIDVSVLVQTKTTVRQVQDIIQKTERELLNKVELIDIFDGKQLGEGKKSFTFRMNLQAEDRTLTDAEMQSFQKKLFKNLGDGGFEVRG